MTQVNAYRVLPVSTLLEEWGDDMPPEQAFDGKLASARRDQWVLLGCPRLVAPSNACVWVGIYDDEEGANEAVPPDFRKRLKHADSPGWVYFKADAAGMHS